MELYNTVGYKADPKSGSNIAFANFLNESPSYSDLQKFENEFKIPSQSFEVLALINGGVNDQNPLTESDGEANLDVQNIIGLVDGLPVYAYITGGVRDKSYKSYYNADKFPSWRPFIPTCLVQTKRRIRTSHICSTSHTCSRSQIQRSHTYFLTAMAIMRTRYEAEDLMTGRLLTRVGA